MRYVVKDVAGAEAQVARTADLKAEVDAREDRFVHIKSTSEQLIKQGHFAKKEVMIKQHSHVHTS